MIEEDKKTDTEAVHESPRPIMGSLSAQMGKKNKRKRKDPLKRGFISNLWI